MAFTLPTQNSESKTALLLPFGSLFSNLSVYLNPIAMTRLLILVVLVGFFFSCTQSDNSQASFGDGPAEGTLFMYPERIPLEAGSFFTAERGMLYVKENRSDPNSNIIGLEVYRFGRNQNADPNTPPIFFLHGGPSFGGLERSLQNLGLFEERWAPFLDISDLVVVSQRGIGPSKPTTTMEVTLPAQDPSQKLDLDSWVEGFHEQLTKEKEAWEATGMDLSGYTILEAAADIDDTRKALGYDKIVIWGGSFGSHWGMAVMRYYPQIVERAVMRGMEGPDHTYDHPGHIWNVYERVAEEAEQVPGIAEKVPNEGLIQSVKTMLARHLENPVTVTADGQDVLFDVNRMQALSRGYSGGLRGWPANIISLYNGDFDDAAMDIVEDYRDGDRSYATASYWMLDCGSGITPARWNEYISDPASTILLGMNWWYNKGCMVWDSDLGDEFRQNFETEIPTVIVHGTWDTSTPYENALELVPFFKNSKFVTVKRGPHGAIRAAFRASPEFQEALLGFAGNGDMSTLPDSVEIPAPQWIMPD